MSEDKTNSSYQTFLPDCDCYKEKAIGILFKDNIVCCRWCRTPYGKGGSMFYKDSHFEQSKTIAHTDKYSSHGQAVENLKNAARNTFAHTDYEIVSFKNIINGTVEDISTHRLSINNNWYLEDKNWEINSVRRLSVGK